MKPLKLCETAKIEKPSREDAEAAVETLLRWMDDDPSREGLKDTPARVVRAYEEYTAGRHEDAVAVLARTFEDIQGYDDFVLVKGIEFVSMCEHHLAVIRGVAHVAYMPDAHVVGISKLARVVDIFARRLNTQEMMTRRIVDALNEGLKPKGVAVMIEADHQCMSTRGVKKHGSKTVTSLFSGVFKDNESVQHRFIESVKL